MLGWSSSHICFQLQSGRRAECMDEASEWVSSMRACISGCIVCKCMLCMYCMCRETMLACEEHHWTRVYVWVMLLLNARHAIVSPCVCARYILQAMRAVPYAERKYHDAYACMNNIYAHAMDVTGLYGFGCVVCCCCCCCQCETINSKYPIRVVRCHR